MDDSKQKAMLNALLEQKIPSTTWSIDPLGDVWMINIVTGKAEIIMHYCEMDDVRQELFAQQIIDGVLENKKICRMTSGKI
ncbi:hypothetical protein [Agarilytica rhodophyticola]|uniref:hypothetical protein n=1 Tax=Agarilytica rhodophyticola TaxID=1737490 RepID=UPI000B34101A|nr:hypothetical protein [Agarilytica rhodophyticola]